MNAAPLFERARAEVADGLVAVHGQEAAGQGVGADAGGSRGQDERPAVQAGLAERIEAPGLGEGTDPLVGDELVSARELSTDEIESAGRGAVGAEIGQVAEVEGAG